MRSILTAAEQGFHVSTVLILHFAQRMGLRLRRHTDALPCCSICSRSDENLCEDLIQQATCLCTQKGFDGWKASELCWTNSHTDAFSFVT